MMGFLGDAIAGNGTLVMLSGETGVGKTRLIEEFRVMAMSTGCRFLMGCCLPGSPGPYLPFAEAFQRCIAAGIVDESFLARSGGESRSREVTQKIPSTCGSERSSISNTASNTNLVSNDGMEGDERALFSTLQVLKTMTAKKPMVLCIEDLQWADSASIQLLHFLARNSSDLRLLLVGTYGTEETKSEVSGRPHPLLDTLRIMRREAICHEIHLDPLGSEDLKIAIEGMLGGTVDRSLMEKIVAESGGNPLFAIETVRHLVSSRSIILQAGTWRAVGTEDAIVPLTVKEIITRRVGRIPGSQRKILDCAAVVGDCFDPETLGEVLGMTRLALLEEMDYIEKDFQIVRETEGRYRFDPEVTKRIIYEQIPVQRRGQLHKAIGEVLESRLADDSMYGELSLHFLNAGVRDKCVRYSLLAGDSCLGMVAMREAIPYYRRVIDVARDDDVHSDAMLRALEGLGIANMAIHDYQAALESFDHLLRLSADPKIRARALRRSAECWLPTRLGRGDPSKSMSLLECAERCEDIDAGERCEMLALRASIALLQGQFDDARECCREAETSLKGLGAFRELTLRLTDHAGLLLSQGSVSEAIEKLREAAEANAKASDERGLMKVIHCLGVADIHLGKLEDALARFDESLEIASKLGDGSELCCGHMFRGIVLDMMGDFEAAVREAETGREHALSIESAYLLAAADALLGHTLIRTGRIGEARAPCHEAAVIAESFDWRIRTPVRGLVAISMAELHGMQNREEESKREFEEAIDLFRGGLLGTLFEALARNWYGDCLAKHGAASGAETQYAMAAGIFEKSATGLKPWKSTRSQLR